MGYFLSNLTGPQAVHGFADDVEDAAEDAFADGDGDGGAGVDDFLAADEAVGGGHGDGADEAFAAVLLDFEDEAVGRRSGRRLRGRCKFRESGPRELDVDDGADDLDDFAGVHREGKVAGLRRERLKQNYALAAAAAAISRISWVMAAWRALLYSRERSAASCLALSVAFFMATMRAECSLALAREHHLINLLLEEEGRQIVDDVLGGRLKEDFAVFLDLVAVALAEAVPARGPGWVGPRFYE